MLQCYKIVSGRVIVTIFYVFKLRVFPNKLGFHDRLGGFTQHTAMLCYWIPLSAGFWVSLWEGTTSLASLRISLSSSPVYSRSFLLSSSVLSIQTPPTLHPNSLKVIFHCEMFKDTQCNVITSPNSLNHEKFTYTQHVSVLVLFYYNASLISFNI